MKKIMYIVDYFPNESNSVADILGAALDYFKDKYKQTVVKRGGYDYAKLEKYMYNEVQCYSAVDIGGGGTLRSHKLTIRYLLFKFMVKLAPVRYRETLYHKANIRYLEKMIKRGKPELIVCFCFSPNRELADLCIKHHIPYCYALYDTYLKRPNITPDKIMEEYVIKHSVKYLVPSFFYHDYDEYYNDDRAMPYDLPLLISKEQVEKARSTDCKGYPFVYFGQLQAFRSTEEVAEIFRTIGYALDIFTDDYVEESDIMHKHTTLKGDSLYTTIAHSDFLIALDNNTPYESYLPSKVYLYVSFAKPIIVFGNNEQSAIREFLKDYPCCYYHKIGDSLGGLIEFIDKHKDYHVSEIDTEIYRRYLPQNSLGDVYKQVKVLHF